MNHVQYHCTVAKIGYDLLTLVTLLICVDLSSFVKKNANNQL